MLKVYRKPNLTFVISYSSAFVENKNIVDFIANRDKYITKGRGKEFQEGIKEIENCLKNSTVSLFDF